MTLPRAYQGKISADGTRIALSHEQLVGRRAPQLSRRTKSSDLDRRPERRMTSFRRRGRLERRSNQSGRRRRLLHLDRDGVANVWEYETRSKKLSQITKFDDFDVKSLDSGAGTRFVFEQAGYVHELDPKSGKEKIVNIVATGDFPWMMPNWEDVSEPHHEHGSVADGQTRRRRSTRRDLHDPRPTRATFAILTHSSGFRRNAIRHGRRTASLFLTSATSRASTSS
jgi:hypothetical protein